MRIAINALSARVGGTFTYLTNFLPALGKRDGKNSYSILVRREQRDWIDRLNLPGNFSVIAVKSFGLAHRILLEQAWLPLLLRRGKIDVLYAPSEMAPLHCPCKVVLALRNSNLYTPMQIPWPVSFRARFAVLRQLTISSAKRATRIITTCEAWRKPMAERLGVAASKISVVPHGMSDSLREIGRQRLAKTDSVSPQESYVLSVSTIYRYKNYTNLIKAVGSLHRSHNFGSRLLIIGGVEYDPAYHRLMLAEIAENGLQDIVTLLGNVEYDRISTYYRDACCFVFPSYLESFGHPAVEAMATGTPLAVSDIPVFREVCGEAAVYFNPFDVADMSSTIRRLLSNPGVRASLAKKGFERSHLFDWTKTAELMLQVFEQVGNCRS